MPDLARFKEIDASMEAKKKKLGGGDMSDIGTRIANALITAGLAYGTSALAPGIIGEGMKAVGVGKPVVEGVAKMAGMPEKGMGQAKLDVPEFEKLGEIRGGELDYGEMFKPSAKTLLPAIKTGAKALAEPHLDLGKAAGYAIETGVAPTAEKVQQSIYERAAEAADLIPKTMKEGVTTYGEKGLTDEQALALIKTGEYEPQDFEYGGAKYKKKKGETEAQARARENAEEKKKKEAQTQEYEATRDALSGAITNLVNTLPVSGEGRDMAIGKLKEWEKLANESGLPPEYIRKLKDQIRKAQNTVEDILAEEEISIYGEPKEKGIFRKSTVGTLEGF